MACVNTKSNDFIRCCERLDIHPTQLEPIIHEYINIAGNENSFPDDVYILSKLDGTITYGNEDQLNLWQQKYSKPIEVSTIEQANQIVKEASKYFDEKSISLKHTNNNTYIVSVIAPNVNYNKVIDIFSTLKRIKWTEVLNSITKAVEEHNLIYKEHRKQYLTLGDFYKDSIKLNPKGKSEITELIKQHIINSLEANNINPNAVKIIITDVGRIMLERNDAIEKNEKTLISTQSIESVLSFLETKIPGLQHITIRENSPIFRRYNIDPNAKAFFLNERVYLVEGRFNEDIAIEECLHPFVNALAKQNKALFNELLEAAKQDFPTLYQEIKNSYDEKSIDRELVTQVLSRYTREEFKAQNGIRAKWENLKNKFYEFIKDLFGNIHIDKIKSDTTFKELAQIILSEDGVFEIDLNGIEYHNEAQMELLSTNGIQVDKSYRQKLIEHLKTDNISYSDLGKKELVKLAEALFDYFEKNDFKIRIINKAYSEREAEGKSSAVSTFGKYSTIYYVKQDNQESPYLTILHELLHIVTHDAMPWDLEGKGIVDETLQRYYDAFTAYINNYDEYSKYSDKILNAKTQEELDAIPKKYRVLYHAASSVGEFFSSFLNEKEVRIAANTITWDKGRTLFEWMGDKIKEFLGKLFKGYSYIATENVLEDITSFLLNYQYQGEYDLTAPMTPEFYESLEQAKQYEKQLQKEFDEAIPYSSFIGEIQTNEVIENQDIVTGENTTKQEETFVKHNNTIVQQIDNLNNNNVGLTQTEIREVADDCVYWLNETITNLYTNPEYVFEKFPTLRTLDKEGNWTEENKEKDIDKVDKMSRLQLVQFIGLDNLMNFCKEALFTNNKFFTDDDATIELQEQAQFFEDNFKGLMQIASATWLTVEKFSIQYNAELDNLTTSEEINVDADNFNDESADLDEIRELGDNTRENWQIDRRTEDVVTSMSQLVRNELVKCYIIDGYDSQGSSVYRISKFGVRKRIDTREAVSKLLNWTQGSITYNDMINKLEAKLQRDSNGVPTKNMWLTQLLDKLRIVEGSFNYNADFQSQFFSTMNKPFQLYTIVVKEKDGSYRNVPINKSPAFKEAINSVITSYKIGSNPLFNEGQTINKGNLNKFIDIVNRLVGTFYVNNQYIGLESMDQEKKETLINLLTGAANYLGYYVTPNLIEDAISTDGNYQKMITALSYIPKALMAEADNPNYNPFNVRKNPNGIYGNLKEFLTPITDLLEDTAISSFYDNGKMYQSYVTPSYGVKLMNKFHLEGQAFDEFIMEEFGSTEWFHKGHNIEKGWMNEQLRILTSMSTQDRKKVFQHKVQLSFNKHNYMKTMTDTEYALSIFREYFTDIANIAYYRMPIMSNKPTSEYISFFKYSGDFTEGTVSEAKQTLIDGYYKIFLQELSRIQTCKFREKEGITKDDPRFIKNFDKNGHKFMFLDFLNTYLKDTGSELGKLINDKLKGETIDENNLNTLVKEEIRKAIDNQASKIVQQWQSQGIFDAIKESGIVDKTDNAKIENAIREFVWNDTFAAMNIMQLTVTDIAYYKDAEDLQKRLAQIHAPGIRANINATDYRGRKVSDGISRTIYLTDFEGIKSNIVENVREVFDRKIETAPVEQKEAYRALRDSIVRDFEENINLADAQAFCSPTALRKKMFMFGRWSRRKEDLYDKLRRGEYSFTELQEAFSQPIKPFTYSQTNISSQSNQAPIKTLKVGLQHKNSEYLLIMADAILQGEKTSKPNLLRVLYNVMEQSHYDQNGNYKLDGIDTIQFESAVKAGLYGRIDLRPFSNLYEQNYTTPIEGEKAAFEYLNSVIYNEGDRNKGYNPIYLKEFSYEDYSIQQEVPEHFMEHSQAHGSQTRYIIPSDLPEKDSKGDIVTYDYFDPNSTNEDNIEHKTAQEFKKEYERTIAENIQDSIDELKRELHLTQEEVGDITAQNIALSKILQREILSSPRYGIDLLYACSLNENGEFNIPLGDPIQSKRVEQLINSIIKNRINKQKIKGGPVVQVTNFGTSRKLNIRFKDKKGGILKTQDEWETNKGDYSTYKDYIKENQAGVAYWEVFASLPSKDIFYKFADKNGNIDIKAIERTEPDLLKMIGYRIPTEDKYSIIPMKIVGFLPREAGEGIMMPADVTLTTGSDFDVDKMYLMIKDLQITTKNISDIQDSLIEKLRKHKVFQGKPTEYVQGKLDKYLKNPSAMKNKSEEMQIIDIAYRNMAYQVVHPTQGRAYRDNKIIDMSYSVMTHETTSEKSLNPGGFNQQKKSGYMIQAKRLNPQLTLDYLRTLEIDDLKDLCYQSKNLSFVDTHIQFYKQNAVAGQILGMFAVQKIAHATLESNGFKLDLQMICKLPTETVKNADGSEVLDKDGNPIENPVLFEIGGMKFEKVMEIDKMYDITDTAIIGKTLGSLVAAAADAVKDPILNLMNINSNTTGVLTTMLRLGMPWETASLFLSQKVITDVLNELSSRNLTKFTKLQSIIQEKLDAIKKKYNLDESVINKESLSMQELEEGLVSDDERIQYKTLTMFQHFLEIANAAKGLTTATRFNSISNAVGPLIIDNLIMEHNMENFSPFIYDKNDTPLGNIEDVFKQHPILKGFADTINIASSLFSNMPTNSSQFRFILQTLSVYGDLQNIIYNDRKLMSKLSDFMQSYMLVASGAIQSMNEKIKPNIQNYLSYFIYQFPKDFVASKLKERYQDNPFIQAIKLDTDKNNTPILKVETTGLDTKEKEKLSCGWADLHKVNPKLSTALFLYNFYRTGIGFNPKTFISLLPSAVKVSPEFKDYIDTYNKYPYINANVIIDQFIRNNWQENKLVANMSKNKFTRNGDKLVMAKSEHNNVVDKIYIKIRDGKTYSLYIQEYQNTVTGEITYRKIDALGNNGECFEISTGFIDKSSFNNQALQTEQSSVNESQQMQDNTQDDSTNGNIEPIDDKMQELLLKVFMTPANNTAQKAQSAINTYKQSTNKNALEKSMKSFIGNRLNTLNIQSNTELIDNLYKLLC